MNSKKELEIKVDDKMHLQTQLDESEIRLKNLKLICQEAEQSFARAQTARADQEKRAVDAASAASEAEKQDRISQSAAREARDERNKASVSVYVSRDNVLSCASSRDATEEDIWKIVRPDGAAAKLLTSEQTSSAKATILQAATKIKETVITELKSLRDQLTQAEAAAETKEGSASSHLRAKKKQSQEAKSAFVRHEQAIMVKIRKHEDEREQLRRAEMVEAEAMREEEEAKRRFEDRSKKARELASEASVAARAVADMRTHLSGAQAGLTRDKTVHERHLQQLQVKKQALEAAEMLPNAIRAEKEAASARRDLEEKIAVERKSMREVQDRLSSAMSKVKSASGLRDKVKLDLDKAKRDDFQARKEKADRANKSVGWLGKKKQPADYQTDPLDQQAITAFQQQWEQLCAEAQDLEEKQAILLQEFQRKQDNIEQFRVGIEGADETVLLAKERRDEAELAMREREEDIRNMTKRMAELEQLVSDATQQVADASLKLEEAQATSKSHEENLAINDRALKSAQDALQRQQKAFSEKSVVADEARRAEQVAGEAVNAAKLHAREAREKMATAEKEFQVALREAQHKSQESPERKVANELQDRVEAKEKEEKREWTRLVEEHVRLWVQLQEKAKKAFVFSRPGGRSVTITCWQQLNGHFEQGLAIFDKSKQELFGSYAAHHE